MASNKNYRQILGTAIGVAALVGVALPASAVGSVQSGAVPNNRSTTCPSGATCIWHDRNFRTFGDQYGYVAFFRCIPYYSQHTYANHPHTGADNSATSIANEGNYERDYMYNGSNHTGRHFSLPIKSTDIDLGNGAGVPNGFNNTLSSGYFSQYLNHCS